jgi:DNA-binding CsgD family transcriptional regulator
VELLGQSRSMAEEDHDIDAICRAYTNLSTVLALIGRPQAALEVAEQGMELTRRLGVELTGGAVLLGMSAFILFRLGRLDEAEDLTRELLGRSVPQGLVLFAHTTQVELRTGRGRLDEAGESLAAARRSALGVTDPLVLGHLHAAAAELALWEGHDLAARAVVGEGIRTLVGTEEDQLLLRLCALGVRAEADRAERTPPRRAATELPAIRAAAATLLTRAEAVAAAAESSASFPEARIHAMTCVAERFRLEGRSDAAAWEAVATAWAGIGFPFPAAYARWRQGEALLQQRDRAAATQVLREARRLAGTLGASRLRDEVELVAARGHVDLREPSVKVAPTELSAADEFRLTAREREVLGHVAVGATNRQIARALFISEKTASVHVSNIIGKLGVTNRGEAAALAHRLALVELSLPRQ